MAGGKETPRQKMIGMMYLVLTALLALQVSNSVLEKFIFINKSLERSKNQAVQKNSNTVDRIEKAVNEAGNRPEDEAVLEKARLVREETGKILTELEDLKEEFVQITGGLDENGNYRGVKNQEEVANLMVNKGRGAELKQTLNNYSQFLGEETGLSFDPIAVDADQNPVFKNDPNQKMKDFSELTFQNTPMVAGLASLSQLQTEVVSRESRALEELARQVGAADLKFDQIEVMARPQSNVVAAGTNYSADIFIAASSSAANPTMRVNGNEIPVQGGMGKYEVTASASSYNAENRAEKTYEAEISINNRGKDTTFTKTFEYYVTKPVIQVQSASVQALYLNCGNQLSVQVPALGTSYNPSFSVQGGDAIPGAKTGEVTVVPNSPNVELNVSSNGNFIGTESFPVRKIPKPDLKIFKPNGDEINKRQGESASQLRGLALRAIPDESFKRFLPKDARYRVTEATITLARGPRPVNSINVTNQQANLNSLSGQAKAGDRYVIEIKEVQRKNFRNEVETVNMGGDQVFQVPLN